MGKETMQTIGDYREEKKVKKYYELVKNGAEDVDSGVDANVFRYLKKVLPKSLENKKIIDIGCGDGRWSSYLKSLGASSVCAVDISSDMLNKAKDKSDDLHLIQADTQKLPVKDNSIDIGISTFSLMYFKNLEEVIKEIGRVLKTDGELYIATNLINIENERLKNKLKGESVPIDLGIGEKIRLENLVQPLEQYQKSFEAAGLKIIKEEHFEPEGVEISDDYKYKDSLQLEKVLFILKKVSQ